MVAGRYVPTNTQDMSSALPQSVLPVDSVPSPPPPHVPTPPIEVGRTFDSPGSPFTWSRSNSPPLHPPATPHHGQLEEIHNTPSPGSSEWKGHAEREDRDDHFEDNPPVRKRQKKTRTRQKENPITLLTTAIEQNTEVIKEQHRQSHELLERTAGAQQKMFADLMEALRDN